MNQIEHLLNIINAIGDGIFVKDRRHRWVLMNDVNLGYLGRSREELIGKSDYDFFPKEEADIFWAKDEIVFQTGRENLNEEEITIADGSKRVFLTKKTLYEDKDGNKFIVGVSRDISDRKAMENKLRETLKKVNNLSLTDELTGLYNRRGFITLASQQFKLANRREAFLVILFIDVDNMKLINDQFGHLEGDTALKNISGVLRSSFRESDIVARLGGDEFVVLAIDSSKNDENILITHLKNALDQFNAADKKEYKLALSIGTAHYDYQAPCSVEALLERADETMYQAKKEKKKQQDPPSP